MTSDPGVAAVVKPDAPGATVGPTASPPTSEQDGLDDTPLAKVPPAPPASELREDAADPAQPGDAPESAAPTARSTHAELDDAAASVVSTEPPDGLRLSQNYEADALLARSPFALLVAMLLDQQIGLEKAFTGPYTISQRLGHDLVPEEIAAYDPEEFTALIAQPPFVHRNPPAMAPRIQQLAAYVCEEYGGDCRRLWTEVSTGAELVERFQGLPGFGRTRARILLALLGKQFGITPIGWREAATPYGEEGTRLSIADVTGPESLDEVRGAKSERKIAMKIVQERVSGLALKATPPLESSTGAGGTADEADVEPVETAGDETSLAPAQPAPAEHETGTSTSTERSAGPPSSDQEDRP